MKGIRLYLLVLLILAAFSVYFLLSRRSGSFAPSKHDFAIEDTGRVESVLISFAGEELILSRTGGTWKVDGFPAKKESIRGLHVLISRLEVVAPVSRSLEERIMEALEDKSIRVRIVLEDGREKAYRVFYDSLSGFTFMMLERAGMAFRVKVRGYRQSNLAELFRVDDRYWRDNVIFHYLPGDIKAVFLRNNLEPAKSFHLARNDEGGFELASGMVPGSWMPADMESVRQYLGYFYDVRFDSFRNPGTDTLEHADEPDYVLSLDLYGGERSLVELYPVYRTGEEGRRRADYNRLYARIGRNREWVVLRYIQIDPLLQESGYFTGP